MHGTDVEELAALAGGRDLTLLKNWCTLSDMPATMRGLESRGNQPAEQRCRIGTA